MKIIKNSWFVGIFAFFISFFIFKTTLGETYGSNNNALVFFLSMLLSFLVVAIKKFGFKEIIYGIIDVIMSFILRF